MKVSTNLNFRLLANYMMWEVICQSNNYFIRAVSEKFEEYRHKIYRTKSEPERAKRCLQFVRGHLGLPLSMLYLDGKFDKDKLRHVSSILNTICEFQGVE